jgi:hypothetical protein
MIRSLFSIVLILCSVSTYSEDTELEDLIRKLYGRESFAKNRYIIGMDYGLITPFDIDDTELRDGWNTEIRYGFDRFYPTKDLDIVYYRQETFVLGNVSNSFGVYDFEDQVDLFFFDVGGGIESRTWYGKLAIKDGYGYDTKYGRFTLNHATVLGWGQNDIIGATTNDYLNSIDEVIKPMAAYNSSLRVEWSNGLSLFATAGERQFFHDANFINRTASMALEGAFYILPDLAEDTLIDIFGNWYPWVHRSYNSTVSFLFYYMRHNQSADWPFNTGDASTVVVLRIGADFVIE